MQNSRVRRFSCPEIASIFIVSAYGEWWKYPEMRDGLRKIKTNSVVILSFDEVRNISGTKVV